MVCQPTDRSLGDVVGAVKAPMTQHGDSHIPQMKTITLPTHPEPVRIQSQPIGEASAADITLASDLLMRGRKVIQIQHNGALYQLRATKLGKLILTK